MGTAAWGGSGEGKCFPCHGLSWWWLLLYFPSQPHQTAVRPKLSAVSVIRLFVRTRQPSAPLASPLVYERDDQPGTAFCFAQGDQQVVCGDDSAGTEGSSNTAAYCAIDSQHTMCLHTGPSDVCTGKTILRGMTESGKAAILAKHNALRRRVAKGEESGQPAAADMRELVWDDELEQIAQRWADQCTFEHDNVRTMLDGTRVGQNLYQSFSSAQTDQDGLDAAANTPVQNWYDAVSDFSSANINPFVS